MARFSKSILFAVLALAVACTAAPSGEASPMPAGEPAPLSEGAETRHYTFTLGKDLPLTFFAAFGSIYGNYRLTHMSVTAPEDMPERDDLMPWDRAVMGRYNKTVAEVSDWFAVLGAMPLALGAASWYRGDACGRDIAVYSLMFAQALALQSALNLTFRSMKFWPRPYIYAEDGAGPRPRKVPRARPMGAFLAGMPRRRSRWRCLRASGSRKCTRILPTSRLFGRARSRWRALWGRYASLPASTTRAT